LGKIIQQPLPGLVVGSQDADPATAFEDGQPGLVRAGDSRDPQALPQVVLGHPGGGAGAR